MVSRVQLPPEIQLAQRLAGNEQVTRDRAVRKLRKYIVARTQRPAGGFTHDELLKVWKGLFYCMWMQDKPLVQTFWQTMNREWAGIDRLRLDKFYMIEQLLKLLTAEILHPNSQAPNGVKSHFIEIFLEELTKVGAAELTADQNLRIIDPFCRIAAQTKDSLVLHNIVRSIFDAIVEQAPFAIEDLMNELDAQGEEVEMSVGDDDDEVLDSDDESLEGGEVEQDLPSKKPPKGSICRTEPKLGERQEEDDGDGTSLVLQFDYAAVANRLFKMASQQNTPSQNRKRLYKVIRKLQDLAEGTFPEDDVPEKVYGNLLQGRQERKKKRRSSKSRLQSKKGKGEEEDTKPDPSSRKKSKRKWTRKRGLGADSAEPADSSGQLGKGHGQKGARWGRKKHPQLSRATAKPKKQKGTLESRR
ncbi:Ribosomal RNA processing protein 1 like protein A [Tupaia chinensis]|uniref:Ribosomal RNA processing protein 1 like protein A n=1 Tax=Tupaia chinensis TaxID=246437 RepID=L8Y5J7_TUPCH|nr:Ribosomal RNA processing protein 1 like protein A [Tupaia chinensis]